MLIDVTLPSYIFKQQIIIEVFETIICAGLTVYLLIQLNKKLKKTNSRLKEAGNTLLGIVLIISIYFFFFFPTIKETFDLRKNGVEINGKTIKWINTNGARMIEYSFEVNGMIFIKRCDVVYYGQEIKGIKCPDGNYFVVYDKEDPENSIMDFKRPIK